MKQLKKYLDCIFDSSTYLAEYFNQEYVCDNGIMVIK